LTAWPILDGQLFLATAYVETAAHRIAGGACDGTPQRASVRAHGEAIERASLIENGPGMVVTRQEALERGLSLVVPHDILHDAADWVPARHATTGDGVGVPADVVLLGRVSSQLRLLPWRQSSVGTAAHPDREAAGLSGMLECLERYALRRVWAGTAGLEPATEQLCSVMSRGLVEALEGQRLVAHAWHVREKSPVRVSLVLVARTDRSQATFGAGAAFMEADAGRVLMHALHEAIMVRASLSSRANQGEREVQRGIRSSRHQEAFLTYLRNLEAPEPAIDGTVSGRAASLPDLAALVEERFGVAPLLVDVPSMDSLAVVKAIVPTADFLIPRSDGDYILRPGYLE
jgi:ribosomal protein S12 methylthiotransferase accessory factor YcaO